MLNFTRWLPDELDGQEHCVGLPPSGNTTCTMMMSKQIKLAAALPGGGTGAVLTLSQAPCNDPNNPTACCNSKRAGATCAFWAGAHLVSAGCIQWGVLEIEAAFNMPASSGAFYFTATYVVFGGQDPSWNEIDIGMIANVLGDLEFHATVFTAAAATPTMTMMDALNFAANPIGASVSVTSPVNFINTRAIPKVYYNSTFAAQFHTYKVVWTKNTVVWMVDTVVYRNISYAPWRPMSIRQILRTNKGINAVGPTFLDSNVYLRRIRYTPLSDQAVADAYRCTSSFACYGLMPAAPVGTAKTYVSMVTSTAVTLPSGRRLLDDVANAQRLLEAAVSSIVPGVPVQNIDAAPTAFGLIFRIIIDRLNPQGLASPIDALSVFNNYGLLPSLTSGLAQDVIPAPNNVVIKSVTQDNTTSKVYVSVMVTGYGSVQEMQEDFSLFSLSGPSELDSTAAGLNNALGLASNPYITQAATNVPAGANPNTAVVTTTQSGTPISAILADTTKCPSYPSNLNDATCVNDQGQRATVWCTACVLLSMDQLSTVVTYAVTVPVAASATSSVEAMLTSAQQTGALGNAVGAVAARRRRNLQSVPSSFNLTDTSNLVVQRMCDPGTVAAAAAAMCAQTQTLVNEWRAVSIAFVVGFGTLLIVGAIAAAFVAGRHFALKSVAAARPSYAEAAASPGKRSDALEAQAREYSNA